MADAFDTILGQPKVRDFLRASLLADKVTSAYLFLGPSGSNKTSAAYALAKEIICPLEDRTIRGSGCGKCNKCSRIERKNYTDVKYYEPESSNGYLVEQIRNIIHDINLSPIESDKKIYIIDRVDMMGVSSANAFLKTLEEPPDNVVLILLGRTRESVLSTIVSRCSVVAFRHIPPSEAHGIIIQNTGCDLASARIALSSCGGSITRAIEFLRPGDNSLLYLRGQIVSRILKASSANSWEICKITKELLEIIKAPSDEYLRIREQEKSDESEFLSNNSIKELEKKTKREASKKTIQMLNMFIDIVLSVLKDIESILVKRNAELVNCDSLEAIEQLALRTSFNQINVAMNALNDSRGAIAYNVSSEILINTCLFDYRGAFNDN